MKNRWLLMAAVTVLPLAGGCVEGFTAVIFQHETDHLKGVLYTDKLCEQ